MLMSTILRNTILALIFACLTASVSFAQTTAFNYQGKLSDSGAAQSSYQMRFELFDAVAGGNQIGGTIADDSVIVNQGVFNLLLDFSANVFTGGDRFLEIAVRRNATEAYTVLSPRQQIASSPYSIRTLSAAQADVALDSNKLGGIDASEYLTTTSAGNTFIKNDTAPQPTANFNIDGDGTAGGTLSGNVVNSTAQYNLGGDRVLSNGGVDNFFAGVGAGTNTTGKGNSFFGSLAGQANTTGVNSSFFGRWAGSVSTGNGNTFVGSFAGGNNTSGISNSFFGTTAGGNNTTGSNNTLIGAGANVVSNNVSFGTAIGSGAQVGFNDSVVLGRFVDTVYVPGQLNVANVTTTSGLFSFSSNGTAVHAIGVNDGSLALRTYGTSWFQGDTSPLNNTSGTGILIGTVTGLGYIQAFDYASGAKILTLNNSGGRVGIGTTAPDQTLSVNGNASKVGAGSWLNFSDERLKNIRGRFTTGLSAVMQLQPIRFQYKPDNALNLRTNGEEYIGFTAQSVQKVIPEAVTKDSKGYLLVNNDAIIWTMLNATKEQQTQIEQQQEQLDQLKAVKSENTKLKAELTGIVGRLSRLEISGVRRARKKKVSSR